MITCCKDCQERQIGCHSNCERYKTAIGDYNKQKEEIKRKKELDDVLYGFNKRKKLNMKGR